MTIDSGTTPRRAPSAGDWLAALNAEAGPLKAALSEVYGPEPAQLTERRALLRQVLERAVPILEGAPVRVVRAPGRINLRGMHVDTHGGYLNLMTHQREVVLAVAEAPTTVTSLAHVDPAYHSFVFDPTRLQHMPAFRKPWADFLASDPVREATHGRRGDWSLYVEGAILSVQHRFPRQPLKGVSGVIGGDLPQGAALSSSAALCVACCIALLRINGLTMTDEALIEAAQDAEWYAGSRCGVADQAAIVLGSPGAVVHAALQPGALDVSAARRVPLPDGARILVINSHTTRSISGPQQVAYTRNRFAYSMAVAILHQELKRLGVPGDALARMRSFAALTPQRLAALPGAPSVYGLLKAVPEAMTVDDMRMRYELPTLDAQYGTWFGALTPDERPRDFALRGPLLFGLAESERARVFPDFLRDGDLVQAGRAMTIGHDGDRVRNADGSAASHAVSDADLDAFEAGGVPLWQCPGGYGASSPALDGLVDSALAAGALGACLTGAGIAGTVLALCRGQEVESVARALRAFLATDGYDALAGLPSPLAVDQAVAAVVINHATAGAGEIAFAEVGSP